MICLNCGKQLPEEAKFCIQCGTQINKEDAADQKKKDDTERKLVIGLLAILGVGVLLFIALAVLPEILKDRHRGSMPFDGAQISSSIPLFTPTPKPTPFWKTESYEIEAKAIALQPGQIWWQPLRVEDDWREARLVGRFTAQGGRGNDIYAYVTDGDGLTNIQNNNAFRRWYESGKVTVDTINAPLPPGQSYFVLSNRYSWFAHKSVTFDLRVEYERLVQP